MWKCTRTLRHSIDCCLVLILQTLLWSQQCRFIQAFVPVGLAIVIDGGRAAHFTHMNSVVGAQMAPSTQFYNGEKAPMQQLSSSRTETEIIAMIATTTTTVNITTDSVLKKDNLQSIHNSKRFSQPHQHNGALSRTVEDLAQVLGGHGRARLVWDCYRVGLDPAIVFAPENTIPTTNATNVESEQGKITHYQCSTLPTITNWRRLLPGSRRNQNLGRSSLQQLELLHQHWSNVAPRVEGGVARLELVKVSSTDQTTKLLLRLWDDRMVETVIIPMKGARCTLCISSQVGCRQGCTFCATGKMGQMRSLSTDEILVQMYYALKICRQQSLPTITNVVFMGMGEPCDNAAAVSAAVRQLTKRELFQLSASKVTVSTVASTPNAFALFSDTPCVLAWSVHAARDTLRRQLVPTTQYTMVELRQGLIDVLNQRPTHLRTTMLEVVLIDNVNDSLIEADELATLAQGILDAVSGVKLIVNLIPYNDTGGGGGGRNYSQPSMAKVRIFQEYMWARNIFTHVRTTRGDDTNAACGQLATRHNKSGSSVSVAST